MPKTSYPLGSGSHVEVQWRGMWKDFTVRVDGREIGRADGQAELKQGRQWTLPDGSTLAIVLEVGFAGGGLKLSRNGVPLPGSPDDPKTALKSGAGVLFLIAGLNVVLGVAAELGRVEFLLAMGLGWITAGFGAVFAALGLATLRGFVAALWIGIVLFALDGAYGLFTVFEAGGTPPVGGLVFRVFLLAAMVKTAMAGRTRARGA